MMASGKMIKPMDWENIHIPMEPNMKDFGLTTNNTVKEKKNGLMVPSMKVTINSERKMVLVNFCGQINLHMKVTF